MSKVLILGTQLSGKTTLLNYLRQHSKIAVTEIDEEILKRNDNIWPKDLAYKENVLVPQIVNDIVQKDDVVLFASYLSKPLIHRLKQNNFKVIILEISRDEITKRNSVRTANEKKDDTSRWMVGEIELQEDLETEGIVDDYIDAELPTSVLAQRVLEF
jgi:GTPase SAR1 family protein